MDDEHTSPVESQLPPQADASLQDMASRIHRPLVLVGMMGVGKSSVGKRLATRLGLAFEDADDAIERAASMSIPEIFEHYGEPYFRNGERRVIARLVETGPKVIATGGGAFCNDETRKLILKDALAIWLDSDLDTLVERTARKDNRPLLQQGDPREILARLKAEREPYYQQAHIHVISTNGPHSRTVDAILREIEKWL